MIGLMIGVSLAAAVPPEWTPGLDRVEILSEDPGTWLHHELPLAHHRPATASLRLIEQVQPVWRTPWEGVTVGTSLAIQTVQLERPLGTRHRLSWSAGVQTKLLCPRGLVGGLHWELGRLHLVGGVSLSSMATWQNPHWSQWSLLPTAGIGISR
jgi:hypothetical protein